MMFKQLLIIKLFLSITMIKLKSYTANVLSVELADVYVQSQSKNKHLVILQIFLLEILRKMVTKYLLIKRVRHGNR